MFRYENYFLMNFGSVSHLNILRELHITSADGLALNKNTWPPLPRERDRNPLPFRVPLVLSMFFLISQPRVSGTETEHESFF